MAGSVMPVLVCRVTSCYLYLPARAYTSAYTYGALQLRTNTCVCCLMAVTVAMHDVINQARCLW
jgi:hypothetical protein